MNAFPRDGEPNAAARALVPASAIVMITILACSDAVALRKPATPAPSTSRPTSDGPVATPSTSTPTAPTSSPDRSSGSAPSTPTAIAPVFKPPEELLRIPAFDAPPYVRVRVRESAAGRGVAFSASGGYRIVDGIAEDPQDTRLPQLAACQHLGAATAYAEKGGIRVNGILLPARTISVLVGESGALTIDGQRYHGSLVLQVAPSGGLDAVNLVQLEDYVAGVLFAEMPKNFGEEALRAQAIVARTYALFHAMRGAILKDDQSSQVYAGVAGESPVARRIVQATRGEVLTFDDRLFQTFFHSTCGGRTSSAAEVFALKTPPPMNASVECDGCRDAPLYRWTRKLTTAQFATTLVPRGQVADLAVPEKSADGHALRVQLLDSASRVLFDDDAEGFRNRFNQSRPLRDQIPSMFLANVVRKGATFLLEGRGFGHGVGMCQYGARGMAKRGNDSRAILARYYPASRVKRIYG